MKYLATLLLIFGFGFSAFGQTIKSLGYNATNGQVVVATNVVWTNSFNFSTNTVATAVRVNLGFSTNLTALWSATNASNARSAISVPSYFGNTPFSVIGGGLGNSDSGIGGFGFNTISGGSNNVSGGSYNTIGGGINNINNGFGSTIGGGEGNAVSDANSTISGGYGNSVHGDTSFIGGGTENTIASNRVNSVIVGGAGNTINSSSSFVGGGGNNNINTNSSFAVVVGGQNNSNAGARSVVVGGEGNTTSNSHSMVLGGYFNDAIAGYSFASGTQAKATNSGSFVWSDFQYQDFASTNDNSFNIRAIGGMSLDLGENGIIFRNSDSIAPTRTNLGLGGGITTNRTFVSYNGTNYTTNTVTISNGIITGWTQ